MSHTKRDAPCYRPFDPEWEAKEELQLRELEEARARAAQMEKTMRWWSDCTANWREKWSKVRTERNKAREEARLLRSRAEVSSKEAAALRCDKQELEAELDQLRREIDCLRISGERHQPEQDAESLSTSAAASPSTSAADTEHLERLLDQEASNGLTPHKNLDAPDQKSSLLQLKLDEATKMVLAEKQEKSQLVKNLEKQTAEFVQLKAKYDELRKSRQDMLKELSQARAEHQDELECIRIDLEDEANGRTSLDQRISDLRSQVERLRGENAAEWGRRERLETEKLTLERDNKNLRASLQELEDQLQRRPEQPAPEADVTALQIELQQKTKELLDLRHAHSKLKKVLQEKSTELLHELRRSEQYEAEVKKLRGRIDEIKRELAKAEDEVDSATNNIRKLQRSNDELQEQVENLQVQVEHLQTSQREGLLSPESLGPQQVEEQHFTQAAQLPSSQQPRSAGS